MLQGWQGSNSSQIAHEALLIQQVISTLNCEVVSDLGVPQKLDSNGAGRLDCKEFCNAIKKLVTSGRVWSKQAQGCVEKK